jgi:hypothetical protein
MGVVKKTKSKIQRKLSIAMDKLKKGDLNELGFLMKLV